MDKNIILIHLESVNNLIYRMNPQLFPNIMRIEKEGLSFRKYFSTATSTWMVISDLLYGGLDQYEGCYELTQKPEAFCYQSSLLDNLEHKGYRTGVFVYPSFELPQIQEQLFFGRNVKPKEYVSCSEFFDAFRAIITGLDKYCILISNFLSNISCHSYAVPGNKRTGKKRWEDGYRCLDDMVGIIFQILKETSREENTVVVLYGDHGDDFWGHGYHMGLSHAIEPTAPLIHTPLIVWKNERYGAETSDKLISTTDIKKMIERMVQGELPESFLGHSFVYARSAFAAQPVREGSFNKSYSITDGKTLLLVSSRGLEMYDVEMDPACSFNMLNMFELVGDRIVFHEKGAAGLHFHFAELIDENQKRFIRQKFYYMCPYLYRYVTGRYGVAKRSETEMNREMCFQKINYDKKV